MCRVPIEKKKGGVVGDKRLVYVTAPDQRAPVVKGSQLVPGTIRSARRASDPGPSFPVVHPSAPNTSQLLLGALFVNK